MPRTLDQQRLLNIWQQDQIPVIRRIGVGYDLRVKLPYREDNRAWLAQLGRRRPKWNDGLKCWEIPKAWLGRVVELCLNRYRRVYIVQPHHSQEICARACWEAQGYECECSCLGAHHGSQDSGRNWREVSDAFATRWGEQEIACRMLTR